MFFLKALKALLALHHSVTKSSPLLEIEIHTYALTVNLQLDSDSLARAHANCGENILHFGLIACTLCPFLTQFLVHFASGLHSVRSAGWSCSLEAMVRDFSANSFNPPELVHWTHSHRGHARNKQFNLSSLK